MYIYIIINAPKEPLNVFSFYKLLNSYQVIISPSHCAGMNSNQLLFLELPSLPTALLSL